MATPRFRRRLVLLTVLGALVGGFVAYRKQQIARAEATFHERYG